MVKSEPGKRAADFRHESKQQIQAHGALTVDGEEPTEGVIDGVDVMEGV